MNKFVGDLNKTAILNYSNNLRETINKTNFEKVVQNEFLFSKDDSTYLDSISGTNIKGKENITALKTRIFSDMGIVESRNLSGKAEFALSGESYDSKGNLIKDKFENHYSNGDIYFNGDELFTSAQENNLLLKDYKESFNTMKTNNKVKEVNYEL